MTQILAPPAFAQAPGLYLSWNDCIGPESSASMTMNCASATDQTLVAAFVLGAPVDSVIAVEVVVDVQFDAATVPNWWRFEPGGCRFNRFQPTSLPPPIPTACTLFWGQDLSAGLVVLHGQPRGGANQSHLVASIALPDLKAPRRLDAGTMYNASVMNLLAANPTNCTGCATSACLVLNSIRIGRVPGAIGGDVTIDVAGPGDANRVTWQSGSANCAAVPVRGTTWGRLKELYR